MLEKEPPCVPGRKGRCFCKICGRDLFTYVLTYVILHGSDRFFVFVHLAYLLCELILTQVPIFFLDFFCSKCAVQELRLGGKEDLSALLDLTLEIRLDLILVLREELLLSLVSILHLKKHILGFCKAEST